MKFVILLIGLVIFGCSKTPTDIPIGSQDNVEVMVTFSVDMSYQISEGNFNPDVDELFVAGNFNDWCQETCDEVIRIANDQYDIIFTNSINSSPRLPFSSAVQSLHRYGSSIIGL